ncbi:T3SS effector HopA1 family protein [Nocardia wallacei]|uniref:T3SS effector HopA1 family protein n=1 Tax=Nocardia wallacei TaxID=480035 RepID=UPI002454B0FA|nr:T3SS effector HopA1 family protein [Nocardia wallacei]
MVAPNRPPAFDEYSGTLSPETADRVLSEFPDMFEQPRSLDELRQLMDSNTPFEDLLAIREESYRQNGYDPPPNLARENLEGFMRQLWDNRDDIGSPRDVYSMYAGSDVPNYFSDPRGHIQDLAQIFAGRTPDARVGVAQMRGGKWPPFFAGNVGEFNPADIHFVHYQRENASVDAEHVDGRVYVNPRADAAAGLMHDIVREIVDNPRAFPGIYSAKVEGAAAARPDGLVIYTSGDETAQRVVAWLAEYQARNPDAFMWEVPAMTYQVLPGVGFGAEPSAGMGGSSFGIARANPLFEALRATRAQGGDFTAFRDNALEAMDRAGVDPRRPHRNRW